MDTWIQLLASFITGGALVGVLNFAKWFLARRDRLKEDRITKVLEIINDVYHYLHILQKETRAQRCAIIRIENGGEIPVPGKDLYSSVAFETYDHTLAPIKHTWQKQKVDEEYAKVLIDIAKNESKTLHVDQLNASLLKDLYQSQEIVWSEMYKIKSAPGSFFYLVMSYTKEFEPGAYHRNIVRAMAGKIALTFKSYD